MRQAEAVETLRYQDGQSAVSCSSQAMAKRHGCHSTILLMLGLTQSLIPGCLGSCCSRWALIDSCKVINRKTKSIGEVGWKRHFNTKSESGIPQGFRESLFHVDGVFPNDSYFTDFFLGSLFQLNVSLSVLYYISRFCNSVLEGGEISMPTSFWSSERWLAGVHALPLKLRIVV